MRDKLVLWIIFTSIAIIFALPHIYGVLIQKTNYSPLKTIEGLSYINDETYAYASEVNKILRFGIQGDPFIWENRSIPSPFVGELTSILLISLLSLVTGSIPNGFIGADMIFPPALFLLIYTGLKYQGFKTPFSMAASLGVITTPFMSLILPKLTSYGTQFTGTIADPLFFSRTPHPQISTIFLFAPLFLIAFVLKNPDRKIIYLFSISVGLSMYASPYVTSTVLGGLLLLTPTIFKTLSKKTIVILLAIISAAILGWVINFVAVQKFLRTSDFLFRSTFPQDFLFPGQLRFLILGLIVLAVGKKSLFFKVLAAFLISGSVMADLHQIIIGRNVEADHWLTRVLAPLGTLAIFLIIQKILAKYKADFEKFIWITAISGLLAVAFSKQTSWIASHPELLRTNQNQDELFKQIESGTGKNDVIGVLSSTLSSDVVARTGRWVYLAPGDRTLSSSREQIQRACDLIILSNRQDDDQLIFDLSRHAIGLEKFDKEKAKKAFEDLKLCTRTKPSSPRYKLDYVVFENKQGQKLKLVPVNQLEMGGNN